MGRIGRILAIIVIGIFMLPITKEILDALFDSMVADLPGLTAFESVVMGSYPYAIVLGIIVAIFLTIRGDRKKGG